MIVGTRRGDYPWWLFFRTIHRSGLVIYEILLVGLRGFPCIFCHSLHHSGPNFFKKNPIGTFEGQEKDSVTS